MAGLTRWDPFAGLTSMHSQIDDMFNNFFGAGGLINRDAPAMDVYSENDKELITEIHAPGFDKSDIQINVNNGVLEIKGEKHEKDESKNKKRNYMMRESHESFYRSIALPKTAVSDKVKASFVDGVLKITIPLKELPAPKKISIEGGTKK